MSTYPSGWVDIFSSFLSRQLALVSCGSLGCGARPLSVIGGGALLPYI